jgi:glyoxylase-like metal-dependent hydrolase (beta-lactamase superfamily II)
VSEPARVYRLNQASKMTLRANATLVVDGDRRILVDLGCFASLAEIDAATRAAAGLGVDDITDCYFTHLHFDHYKPLFPAGCRVRFPRREHEFIGELMRFKDEPGRYRQFLLDTHELIAPVFLREFLRLAADPRYQFAGPEAVLHEEGEQLSPHVWTVGLAGHCPGQLGLRVETAAGVCLIAGDAVISLDDFLAKDTGHHLIVFNREQLLRSRQRVAEADFVVPGHGDWFDPRRGALFESSGANP